MNTAAEHKLEEWLDMYGDSVLRTCFIYLADHTLAEDALQDTFIKIWRNIDRFEARNESTVKTWILRIAINTCKDYKRSAWCRHVNLAHAVEDIPPAFRPVPAESRELFSDLMRLPGKYKQVILLYYYHHMTMAETAEALGISRPTVRHRLQKAYALLRVLPEGSDLDA